MKQHTPLRFASTFLLLTLLVLAFAIPATASGPSRAPSAGVDDQVEVTQTQRCRVLQVRPDGALKLQDVKTELESWMRVTEKTRIRAQDKAVFAGRKKLDLADITPGQWVKITTLTATGELVRVKVLRDS